MSMIDSIAQAALQMMNNDPNFQKKLQSNPTMQEYVRVIQNRDNARGEEIARGLMGTYGNGASQNDICKQASQFLQSKFFGNR